MKKMIFSLFCAGLIAAPSISIADDTVGEKVEEAANDTGRAIKKTARKAKNKTCEMVNGKMECAAKKVKNSAKNVGDKVDDATD